MTVLAASHLVLGATQPNRSLEGYSQNTLSFLPAVAYDSGGNDARSVVIADVNGDGKPDLVVANICLTSQAQLCSTGFVNGAVSVLLGNGDGTFRTAVTYDSKGLYALAATVADVNGDGKPDILVANRGCQRFCGNGTVAVLLGNGDGTFQPAVTYNSGDGDAWSVAVADVNSDGRLDLVVANNLSSAVGVLLGNGDGTFQSAVSYPTGAQGGMWVAIADVNGDKKMDLLVAAASGAVGVLMGNGDGTFQPAVDYAAGGSQAISVTVADVNGDGKPDLLVANYIPGGSIGVLLGNGDGTFQPAVTYASGGNQPASIAVADVNSDGKLDMIVANLSFSVDVLLGNGDGTFQGALYYNSGGAYPDFVAAADLNADGLADIVAANMGGTNISVGEGSVGVLLNNSTFSKFTTATTILSSLNPSVYGQAVTWTAAVTSSGSVLPTGTVKFKWSGYVIGSGTLNASGIATLTRSNLNADPYPLVAVYVGDAANLGSTSPVLNQVILQAASSATITSSLNPSKQGQAVTFTATITSPTVIPTGPVTFTSGKTVLGTAQLSNRVAKFTTSTLAVGSSVITATYYGSSNIQKSSASLTQTVNQK